MNLPLRILVLGAASLAGLAGCTFPSARPVVSGAQTNVLQRVETGTVIHVREVTIEGQRTNLGLYGGGVVGAAGASGIGRGVGNALATAGGAVAGAIVGQATEESLTRKRAQEIMVKLDDGDTVVVTQEASTGLFRDGDRVVVMNGGYGAARVKMLTN